MPKRLASISDTLLPLTQRPPSTQADLKANLRAGHDTYNSNPCRFDHPDQPRRLWWGSDRSGDLIAFPPPPQTEVATLANLTPDAVLWMRDPRRTPVRVTTLSVDTASFTVEVLNFEDKGARWTFPVWQSDKFLCDPEMPTLPQSTQEVLKTAGQRLNQPLHVPADATQRANTEAQRTKLTAQAHAWLSNAGHSAAPATTPESFSALTDPDALST